MFSTGRTSAVTLWVTLCSIAFAAAEQRIINPMKYVAIALYILAKIAILCFAVEIKRE
jgi:hypothetical protein